MPKMMRSFGVLTVSKVAIWRKGNSFLWDVIEAALIVCTGAYLALVLFFILGWVRRPAPPAPPEALPKVSIVVPFRDEGPNLMANTPAARTDIYPLNRTELIYVDDHSEDGGPEHVVDLIHQYPDLPIDLISLTKESGKKAALTAGIHRSNGQIVATLDADTRTDHRWLHTLAHRFGDDTLMLVMPVQYAAPKRGWQSLLALEFTSLVASGMASLNLGLPLMANGANLAFRRAAWLEVNGYQSHAHIPSGDDLFLMFALDNLAPGSVRGVLEPAAIAYTDPPASLREFVHQRIRWAGKTPAYKHPWPIGVAVTVLGWNMVALAALIGAFWWPQLWAVLAWCAAAKLVVDSAFLYLATGFFHQRKLLVWLPVLATVYPFYTVGIGLASLLVRPWWKGRKLDF